MELQRHSSGVAKAGLATGIVGSSLGLLNIMGNLGNAAFTASTNGNNGWGWNNTPVVAVPMMNAGFGWGYGNGWNGGWGRSGDGCCSEDHLVDRYEASLQAQIAQKDSAIALRDANTYGDQKMLEMYKYMDGRFREFEAQFAQQAVKNQATADSFQLAEERRQCCCDKMKAAIEAEARERRCNDQILVNYVNQTFYPKQVADLTTAATSVPQSTYNPLPACCCDGNNN